ncbi:hypothetical protein L6452_06531 [Arctium lappa]|uniref:Uncharacterized protein n=1 Tax=Arctium lappa TaxID=4217 RepID=A0ACB9EK50_ARCLA|nr:hypothetical protein L6452_06531 [Arctium lappa]
MSTNLTTLHPHDLPELFKWTEDKFGWKKEYQEAHLTIKRTMREKLLFYSVVDFQVALDLGSRRELKKEGGFGRKVDDFPDAKAKYRNCRRLAQNIQVHHRRCNLIRHPSTLPEDNLIMLFRSQSLCDG